MLNFERFTGGRLSAIPGTVKLWESPGRAGGLPMVVISLILTPLPSFGQSWHGYLGAKGQFAYRKSFPGFNNNAWQLAHRMALEGGSYRLLGQKNMAGIGFGGRVHSGSTWYYIEPGSEIWRRHYDNYEGHDYGRELRAFQFWQFPLHLELQFVRFPSGQPREGRYYRAGIRTTRYYLKNKGKWHWDIVDGGNITFHLSAGHGWKVGTANNVRMEGNFILEGEWYLFQLSMSFGRWWN